MSTASVSAVGDFRIGGVLRRAWRLCAGDILLFLAVPLLVYIAILAAERYVTVADALADAIPGFADAIDIGILLALAAGLELALLLPLGLNMIGQAVLLLGAVPRLRGEPRRAGEALRKALARAVPLLGLILLWSLALGLCLLLSGVVVLLVGWAFFAGGLLDDSFVFVVLASVVFPASLVPAATLLVMWTVAVPACVIEGFGPAASMRRSAALTKGCRWRIFGILLMLGLLVAAGQAIDYLVAPEAWSLAVLIDAVWSVPLIAYWSATVIMLHHDLRVAKDGVGAGRITEIFA